ncbi:MAG TPA: methyltransferase domain-containing protein [Xanthobacteraceae bacterium]
MQPKRANHLGQRRPARARPPISALALAALLAGVVTPVAWAQSVPDYAAIIAAPDRSEADRETDKRRDPVKLLAFTGVRPGMKVLDMGAGAGYSTELMARAVGASGTVYGQNARDLPARPKERLEARMKSPAMAHAVMLMRPFDDPLPADVRDFDLVTFFFYYHDTTYMPVDRAAMNRKLFAALKPGGALVIADHSARAGDGATVGKTFHRIEESVLRGEVEAAAFRLVTQGDFLRHPEDPRDFNVNRPTGPVDEFVLKFQKPN